MAALDDCNDAVLNDPNYQPLWSRISGPTGPPTSGLNTPQLSMVGDEDNRAEKRTSTPANLDDLIEPEVAQAIRDMSPASQRSAVASQRSASSQRSAPSQRSGVSQRSGSSQRSGPVAPLLAVAQPGVPLVPTPVHTGQEGGIVVAAGLSGEAHALEPEADQQAAPDNGANLSRRQSTRIKTPYVPYQHP